MIAILCSGCRAKPAGPAFDDFFQPTRTLHVSPIEPFATVPSSLVPLSDGRFLIPESGGVWIHVVDDDGQGITRLGGAAPAGPDTSGRRSGTFRALTDLERRGDGTVLAADRTSGSVTVFDSALEPESTFALPEARSVWQLASLPSGGLVAAVSPRHPAAGGQLLIVSPGDSIRAFLRQEPIFRHNRWEPLSATGVEVLGDGRILAYWAPFPWAKVLSSTGDSLPPIGKLSARYEAPPSGPRDDAPPEALRKWYASFTPLLGVEAVGPYLVFHFLGRDAATGGAGTEEVRRRGDGRPRGGAPPRATLSSAAAAGRDEESPRRVFVNLYDQQGRALAKDLLLPEGARILSSDDPSHLYLLRKASPRELEIELWRPTASGAEP